MSGHTPGPWFVGDKYDSERIGPRVVVLGDDGACGDPECCGSPTYQIEIKDADAKLIAAAPALADVLDAGLGELNPGHRDASHACECERCKLYDRARAALRFAGRLP